MRPATLPCVVTLDIAAPAALAFGVVLSAGDVARVRLATPGEPSSATLLRRLPRETRAHLCAAIEAGAASVRSRAAGRGARGVVVDVEAALALTPGHTLEEGDVVVFYPKGETVLARELPACALAPLGAMLADGEAVPREPACHAPAAHAALVAELRAAGGWRA